MSSITLLLVVTLLSPSTMADSLQDLLVARLESVEGGEESPEEFAVLSTSAFEGYMPFESFQYSYGKGEDDDMRGVRGLSGHRRGFDESEVHGFRFNFKSPSQFFYFSSNQRARKNLINSENEAIRNQSRYAVYFQTVQQILVAKQKSLAEKRRVELKRSVDKNGALLGLSKVNPKSVVQEMIRLEQVEVELEGLTSRQSLLPPLSASHTEYLFNTLAQSAPSLNQQLQESKVPQSAAEIERKNLENELQRLNREMNWANADKIVDHFEWRRDSLEREDSFKIVFNVPLRFDREDRRRERALLAAQESALEREAKTLQAERREQLHTLKVLGLQIQSLLSRIGKVQLMAGKVSKARDFELQSTVSQFHYELQAELLKLTVEFYEEYLGYLRDANLFTKLADQNLLDPQWKVFNPKSGG